MSRLSDTKALRNQPSANRFHSGVDKMSSAMMNKLYPGIGSTSLPESPGCLPGSCCIDGKTTGPGSEGKTSLK